MSHRALGTQNTNRPVEVLHIGDLAEGDLPPDVAFPDEDSQKTYQSVTQLTQHREPRVLLILP
jgi:hypothetical protein